ncbi:hypothetical protein Nepgr_022246 [Nepenthes gracilis]|uniref:Uncharacterized protein n=1 Tax=Nepenthes gracilis TaxID=150966 RepID=A0AAD3SZ83_NEPGR|nr:hypothetical protein Nepgr_022246 [Nepenthes gracilis]
MYADRVETVGIRSVKERLNVNIAADSARLRPVTGKRFALAFALLVRDDSEGVINFGMDRHSWSSKRLAKMALKDECCWNFFIESLKLGIRTRF